MPGTIQRTLRSLIGSSTIGRRIADRIFLRSPELEVDWRELVEASRITTAAAPRRTASGRGRSEHLHQVDQHAIDPLVDVEAALDAERSLEIEARQEGPRDSRPMALVP